MTSFANHRLIFTAFTLWMEDSRIRFTKFLYKFCKPEFYRDCAGMPSNETRERNDLFFMEHHQTEECHETAEKTHKDELYQARIPVTKIVVP